MEQRPEKAICAQCGFDEDFEYRWVDGDFLVICPSCKETAYKLEKAKIDSLVQDIVASSLDQIKGTATDAGDLKKN